MQNPGKYIIIEIPDDNYYNNIFSFPKCSRVALSLQWL